MRRKKSAKRREKRRGINRRRHQSQTPYPEKMRGMRSEREGQEGQAGQNEQAQGQRQTNLERAVAELVEENRQSWAEMARLTTLMEEVPKELARGSESTGAGPSGHGGQKEEQDEPEESEEGSGEQAEEEHKESPAPKPAPRRSMRNI